MYYDFCPELNDKRYEELSALQAGMKMVKVKYAGRSEWDEKPRTFDVGAVKADSPEEACELMFAAFQNVMPDPTPGQPGYLSDLFNVRSMCVRDMVEVDGETFVCCTMGFEKVEAPDKLQAFLSKENPSILTADMVLEAMGMVC